jgi:hypothetical protein
MHCRCLLRSVFGLRRVGLMAPKLLNRFKVKVKTEAEDDERVSAVQSPLPPGTMQMPEEDGGAVMSAFQRERLIAQAAPSTQAAPGQGGVVSSRDGQQRPIMDPAAGRNRQITQATAAAAAAQTSSDASGSVAALRLDDLRQQQQQQTRYADVADARIPPIDTSEKPGASPAVVSVKAEGEIGDAADDVKIALAHPEDQEDPGTAFLRQAAVEALQSNLANLNFFTDGAGGPTNLEQPRVAVLQLPRMPAAPSLGRALPAQPARNLLDGLPPGRVGRMQVHRSGKVTLVFDALPEGVTPAVAYSVNVRSDGGQEGIAQNLMAIEAANSDRLSEVRCYDLGSVSQKLVCIPVVSESM